MTRIPRDQWRWLGTNGQLAPWIKCPECDNDIPLIDHSWNDDGLIKPIVACPHVGCEFKSTVILEGMPK